MYGLHIDDVGTRRLSWPRLGRLLSQLPLSAAWPRALAGGEQPWGPIEYLLRNVVVAASGGKWVIDSPQERQAREKRMRELAAEVDAFHIESEARRKRVMERGR